MSGILEQILAEVVGLRQLLTTMTTGIGSPVTAAIVQPAVVQPAVQPAVLTAAPAVTGEMITELVTPYLSGPTETAAREKFKAVMAQMGIDGLQNARPDQWPALYAGFQAVIAQGFAAPASAGII